MKRFDELSQEDKNEVVSKAFDWQREHQSHVNSLLNSQREHYAPSGSDLWHPELWKPAHWLWFVRGGE